MTASPSWSFSFATPCRWAARRRHRRHGSTGSGPGTYYVVAALLVGKPLGILLFAAGARLVGARLLSGLRFNDLAVLGVVASIGFTVSLFFATAAFAPGPELNQTKMGALLSFVPAPIALVLARVALAKRRSR